MWKHVREKALLNNVLYTLQITCTQTYKRTVMISLMNCSISIPTTTTTKSLQSCLTLCNPIDSSPLGSSIHGVFQARILEWAAISFSRGSSWPRDETRVSHTAGRLFTIWANRESRDPQAVSQKPARSSQRFTSEKARGPSGSLRGTWNWERIFQPWKEAEKALVTAQSRAACREASWLSCTSVAPFVQLSSLQLKFCPPWPPRTPSSVISTQGNPQTLPGPAIPVPHSGNSPDRNPGKPQLTSRVCHSLEDHCPAPQLFHVWRL